MGGGANNNKRSRGKRGKAARARKEGGGDCLIGREPGHFDGLLSLAQNSPLDKGS